MGYSERNRILRGNYKWYKPPTDFLENITFKTIPFTMSKKITPKQNESNQQNPNKGTSGTNKQYSQDQGNRGKQLNPNQGGKKNR